jgi:uncharacterized protein YukE
MPESLQALSSPMNPVNALSAAGLGQVTGLVIPLQGVLDRLAGNASAVHSFVDAWNSVSQRIARIQQQLGSSVTTGTADWRGASADKYRQRTDEFAKSLIQFATAAATAANTAKTTAEAVAAGRSAANDLITDLVQRLISLVRQLMALEGGMTATVLAQAGQLVNSFAKPVAGIERQVQTTVNNTAKPLGDMLTVLNAVTRLWEGYANGQEQAPSPQTRSASLSAQAQAGRDTTFVQQTKELVGHEQAHVVQTRGAPLKSITGDRKHTGSKTGAGKSATKSRDERKRQEVMDNLQRTRGLVGPAQRSLEENDKFGDSGKSSETKSDVQGRTRGLVAHEVNHPAQQRGSAKPGGE